MIEDESKKQIREKNQISDLHGNVDLLLSVRLVTIEDLK